LTAEYIQASGALFEAVQRSHIFSDSKTFPDSLPKTDPDLVIKLFEGMLARFVSEHFELPPVAGSGSSPRVSMEEHIDNLWDALTRKPDLDVSPHSTQIALPYPYVVPGGRFRESYYWDTYFTTEGLVASGRLGSLKDMVKNFADLIERYGHIPNGNRVYFLSRSQPPFFCCMLQLLEQAGGFEAIDPYLDHLESEYRYWMDSGAEGYEGSARPYRRTVALEQGVVLNRYWDDRNVPREESFREDEELYWRVPQNRQAEFYRNMRAAAESGWDFSSRWLVEDTKGDRKLESIRTTEIVPVDLNCLLFNVERQLARWLERKNAIRASEYAAAAAQRQSAILKYCWNQEHGWFFDYCWRQGVQTDVWSLAGVYPLFVKLADDSQARRVAEQVKNRFLSKGGVVTTTYDTTQQWDAPNGWAPLQWVTVQGLLKYDDAELEELAREIAKRFTGVARAVYQRTGKMMEKYDVCDLDKTGGGGEYPLQDGFGWTNGVVKAFIRDFSLE
jgi:alpha,alpha-trehalase